jgi:transposase
VIQIAPQMRLLVAVEPVDFRRGIDGLAGVCRQVLNSDPFSGAVFVFRNRRQTALKILMYDGQGFWLCYKRLSRGRFQWWPVKGQEPTCGLMAHELQTLIWNGQPQAAMTAAMWRPLAVAK